MQYFPQILQPGQVVGRLAPQPGPAEAINFADLFAAMAAGTTVAILTNTYSVTPTDTVIYTKKTTLAATTIQLPSVLTRNGKALNFFDSTGNSGPITFLPAAGETLNGLSSWSVPSGASLRLVPVLSELEWLVEAPLALGSNAGTGLLDFTANGATDAALVITGQGNIVAGSQVEAWVIATATVDHSADEHWIDKPDVTAGNIVPGASFTIYGVTPRAYGHGVVPVGKWTVAWRWL